MPTADVQGVPVQGAAPLHVPPASIDSLRLDLAQLLTYGLLPQGSVEKETAFPKTVKFNTNIAQCRDHHITKKSMNSNHSEPLDVQSVNDTSCGSIQKPAEQNGCIMVVVLALPIEILAEYSLRSESKCFHLRGAACAARGHRAAADCKPLQSPI
eukprot:6458081-Amphidinium_carterae.1